MSGGERRHGAAVAPPDQPCEAAPPLVRPCGAHGVVAQPFLFAGERIRRAGHRPEVDPLSLARHPEHHPHPARRTGGARRECAPTARGIRRHGQPAGRARGAALDVRPAALRAGARRVVAPAGRPDPARPSARCDAGRHLRPADADEGAAAAADAGPCQPAFPARLPGDRRRAAGPLSQPLRRRPGAPGQRPMACPGRSYRGAVGHRLCAGDAPGAGPQPARSLPLDPGSPPAAVHRSLARLPAGHGAARRRPAQHGGTDAGFAVADLLRARLPVARAGRAAGRRRRPGGARRRGVDQDAGRPAAGPHAAAPARQLVR